MMQNILRGYMPENNMSATNWRICPNCVKQEMEFQEQERENARKAYGKVSEAEYNEMKARAETPRELTAENLREDYGAWIDGDFVFHFNYGCSCEVCGFEFSEKIEKKVKVKS